jgi:hypothetical protein
MSPLEEIVKAALLAATYHNGGHTALRGVIGAGLLLGKLFPIPTIGAAAVATGVSTSTIGACKTLLATQDAELLAEVLRGEKPLVPTAQSVKIRARLITDFDVASDTDFKALVALRGVDTMFDRVIAPHLR